MLDNKNGSNSINHLEDIDNQDAYQSQLINYINDIRQENDTELTDEQYKINSQNHFVLADISSNNGLFYLFLLSASSVSNFRRDKPEQNIDDSYICKIVINYQKYDKKNENDFDNVCGKVVNIDFGSTLKQKEKDEKKLAEETLKILQSPKFLSMDNNRYGKYGINDFYIYASTILENYDYFKQQADHLDSHEIRFPLLRKNKYGESLKYIINNCLEDGKSLFIPLGLDGHIVFAKVHNEVINGEKRKCIGFIDSSLHFEQYIDSETGRLKKSLTPQKLEEIYELSTLEKQNQDYYFYFINDRDSKPQHTLYYQLEQQGLPVQGDYAEIFRNTCSFFTRQFTKYAIEDLQMQNTEKTENTETVRNPEQMHKPQDLRKLNMQETQNWYKQKQINEKSILGVLEMQKNVLLPAIKYKQKHILTLYKDKINKIFENFNLHHNNSSLLSFFYDNYFQIPWNSNGTFNYFKYQTQDTDIFQAVHIDKSAHITAYDIPLALDGAKFEGNIKLRGYGTLILGPKTLIKDAKIENSQINNSIINKSEIKYSTLSNVKTYGDLTIEYSHILNDCCIVGDQNVIIKELKLDNQTQDNFKNSKLLIATEDFYERMKKGEVDEEYKKYFDKCIENGYTLIYYDSKDHKLYKQPKYQNLSSNTLSVCNTKKKTLQDIINEQARARQNSTQTELQKSH